MKVPYLDLKPGHDAIKVEMQYALDSVMKKSWFILGDEVAIFEKNYADFSGTRFAVGVANGLDALTLVLRALGIGPGDEVIVPSNTYIATWLAVSHVGATIIPVEPESSTCNINPALIEAKISSKTKAILPVHLYGRLAEMEAIMDIADSNKLYVIEDNAQAQGATRNGKKSGSYGIGNATSFYPGKNLGCLGDGGAITTNDEGLYHSLRMFRNYGSEKKYIHDVLGFNSRLDELQAAILNVKLKHLDDWNQKRRMVATSYNQLLSDCPELLLPEVSNASMVNHIYQVRTSKRDQLQAFLTGKGIQTLIHYPVPPHLQKAYAHLNFTKGYFPIAEKIASSTLSLPIFPFMENNQVEYVAENIKFFFATK